MEASAALMTIAADSKLNLLTIQCSKSNSIVDKCKAAATVANSGGRVHSTNTPPLKPPKRLRNEQSQILRCKRRLDFTNLGYALQKPQPATVARRNERERNRVRLINMTFATLRQHLPTGMDGPKNKKMSKVDTLKSAIEYIRNLQGLLDEHDAVNAAFSGCLSPTLSPANSLGAGSPGACSSVCSDSPTEATLSPDDEDLLDFTNWF